MGGIIFGTVVMIVGALFAFAENQKTKICQKMNAGSMSGERSIKEK